MPAPKDAATRLPNAEKSLPRLLLEVCGQIAALVVPMFFITLLAPEFAVLAVLGSAAAMWLGARLGWLRFARGGSQLMSSAVFGLGFSLGRAVPEYWNIAAAALVIMVGLASVAIWERLFGLVSEFDDSWLRAQHPRMGGYLLTATGIGVSNLAPSLIWSVYGRYLDLTRLCTDMGSSRGPAWLAIAIGRRAATQFAVLATLAAQLAVL